MFKAIFAVVLLGLASASTVNIETNMFSPMHFVKSTTPLNLLKNFVESAEGKIVKDGHVKFAGCSSSANDFVVDLANTHSTPAVITKGITAALNLAGLFKDSTVVTNVHLDVTWNGTFLYKEDHP